MIYPEFIKKGETIGICAPSAGVGKKLDDYLSSISILEKEGYLIKETKSVRNNNERSTDSFNRAKELNELVIDEEVKMIILAAGGDFMLEMMEDVNFENLKNHPKWIMGYSDPTNLLFPLTCKYDIATLYGYNASSYEVKDNRAQRINLNFLKGNLKKQKSYRKYRKFINVINNSKKKDDVSWISKENCIIEGRCIGGCFDVIDKLMGTKFDFVNEFIERYKDEGIVWYFDNFAENSYQFYMTLLQMKYAGYFKYCNGVLFGRTAFENILNDITYKETMDLVLKDIPYICEMDIGHTEPRMTMINGAYIKVKYEDHKGEISFKLK